MLQVYIHAIKKPQLLPQYDVIIICYLVSYWFRRGLEDFTANQSSFYLNTRLRSSNETTVIVLKKTIANTKLSRQEEDKNNTLCNIHLTWGFQKQSKSSFYLYIIGLQLYPTWSYHVNKTFKIMFCKIPPWNLSKTIKKFVLFLYYRPKTLTNLKLPGQEFV
jgi:hypothetical protein